MKLIFKSEIDLKRIVFILIQSELFEMTKLEIKKDTRNKSFFREIIFVPLQRLHFCCLLQRDISRLHGNQFLVSTKVIIDL